MKQLGLSLPHPTKIDPENCTASCVITGHLVAALRGQEELQTADHSTCLQEGRKAVRKRSVPLAEEALAKTLAGYLVQGARRLRRVTKMGAWLTVHPSTVKGIKMGAQECRDALFLLYGLET